jgi:predicted CoA-binding protein
LGKRRVAVTGVSRHPENHGANFVSRRLRERGYEVFAVNPNADEVEGDKAYHDLTSIPGGVDAVVIGTTPDRGEGTMEECVELGIERVWMHRSFGGGSVSAPATRYGREHGITVIDGGCPACLGRRPTAGTRSCLRNARRERPEGVLERRSAATLSRRLTSPEFIAALSLSIMRSQVP